MSNIIGGKKEKNIIKYNNYDELLYDPKFRTADVLGNCIQSLKKQKRIKVGFTNGKFRILTPAHAVFLSLAKSQCDILIVAINSDYSLRLLKEEAALTTKERAFLLSSLSIVDYVTSFDEETPYLCMSKINPDVVIKGEDYKEKEVVSGNREVIIIDFGVSTHASDILNQTKFKYFKV